jgi:hypothetical protein
MKLRSFTDSNSLQAGETKINANSGPTKIKLCVSHKVKQVEPEGG